VTLRQRIRFFQQLAVLARAGVSFRTSLERLRDRLTGRQLEILSAKVNAGERLNEAFTSAGFSPFECHLIAAGERSGKLDVIFEHISDYWKRELEMRQALIRPLFYPIGVLHLSIIVGAVVEMVMTSWPVALYHMVVQFAFFYAFGFILYMVVKATWTSDATRQIWLWIPIIGGSLKTTYAYRWITALKLEFIAGITLSRAVGDAWRASGYTGCEQTAVEGEEAMRNGVMLSMLMGRWRQLPHEWVDFVETGEVSGQLEAAFTNLEAEAARAWTLAQQRMSDWLPKIVYFFVLLIAGAMVIQVAYQAINAPFEAVSNALDGALK
jgi:type II secretory pathway component PulF